MNRKSTDQPIIRPAFFDGQMLTAADLNAFARLQQELRWLHNRGLHNWGIAFGYELTGPAGERVVSITPGYALDCRGRELVLPEAMQLPIPPVVGPTSFHLTASYAEDEKLQPVTRAGTCGSAGAVRRPEQPVIRWRDPSSSEDYPRPGLDVVLGSIVVANCRLAQAISGADRRNARPETQPYVAAGATLAGETDWTLWPEARPVGVGTKVDTSAAGFRSTPTYHVQVLYERLVAEEEATAHLEAYPRVFAGYPSVADSTATGFELRVVMPVGYSMLLSEQNANEMYLLNQLDENTKDAEFLEMIKTTLGWHVSWLGIEG